MVPWCLSEWAFHLVACPGTNPTQQGSLSLLILLFLAFIPFPHWQRVGNDGVCLQRQSSKRRCGFCLAFLYPSLWRKPVATLGGLSSSRVETSTWEGMKASCRQSALTCCAREGTAWKQIFQLRQALRRLQLWWTSWPPPRERRWARALLTHRNCEIIALYCWSWKSPEYVTNSKIDLVRKLTTRCSGWTHSQSREIREIAVRKVRPVHLTSMIGFFKEYKSVLWL